MTDMSLWDADQPGTTKTWWVERRGCIPAGMHNRFNEFTHLLNEYNLNPDPERLDALGASVGALVAELGSSSMEPLAKTPLGKVMYKAARMPKGRTKPEEGSWPKAMKSRYDAQVVPDIPTGSRMSGRERVATILNRPGLRSLKPKKGPTDNVQLALVNLMESLGGEVARPVPPAYDV
jgi:hypothetical protein